ncbi:MAG: NAD(P)H-dependent oxidoreductase [Pseudomonadota bacterium]
MKSDRSSKALLLVGSPRYSRSNSESIGSYLLSRMQAAGWQTEMVRILPALGSAERSERLALEIEAAEVVILTLPLYVDSLPAPVIRMMEFLKDRGIASAAGKRFFAIVNSGFPESYHNDVALMICQQFAREVGLSWYGGLSVGGGEVIGGRPFVKVGGAVRFLRTALELTADALVSGKPFPEQASALAAKPAFPAFFYRWMGNRAMRKEARKYGRDLRAKPFGDL